tara:strand:- start:3317 stop:3745 length:429 start_codon:yes stop_codon:yes gene_type:complete
MNRIIITFIFTITYGVVFSQDYPKVLVIENDTCLIFTIEQARKLTEWDLMYEECSIKRKLDSSEIAFKDSIISIQESKMSNYKNIEANYNLIVIKNNDIRQLYIEEKNILKSQLKKERRKKVFNQVLGIAGTVIMTVLYLLK